MFDATDSVWTTLSKERWRLYSTDSLHFVLFTPADDFSIYIHQTLIENKCRSYKRHFSLFKPFNQIVVSSPASLQSQNLAFWCHQTYLNSTYRKDFDKPFEYIFIVYYFLKVLTYCYMYKVGFIFFSTLQRNNRTIFSAICRTTFKT